jgi:hypothetical protein
MNFFSRTILSSTLAAVLTVGSLSAANAQNTNLNIAPLAATSQTLTTTTVNRLQWAVVGRFGDLMRHRLALSAKRLGTGYYEVIFQGNVSKCSYTATIGNPGSISSEQPGSITVVGRNGDQRGVLLATTNSNGVVADRGFHLTVNC